MFIAQVGHESGSFSTLVESLNYAADRLVPLFDPGALLSSRLQHWGAPKRSQLTSRLSPI
jgi:putative chitinase